MKEPRVIACLVCLFGWADWCWSEAEVATVIGEAYDIKNKTLLYREYHYYGDDKLHRVVYRGLNEQVIAEKQLRYDGLATEPSLEQNNTLCGEYIKVSSADQDSRLNIIYQADYKARQKQKQIKRSEELVIDAGFNQYVQSRWGQLTAGKTLTFQYLVPSRLRSYAFTLRAVDCPGAGGLQCFIIAPDVWYLNLVVDPIQLKYNKETRQLVAFTGLGNIADEKCDYLAVDIHYAYQTDSL